MKKIYVAALLILLALGIALPLWYSARANPEAGDSFTAAGRLPGDVLSLPGAAEGELPAVGKGAGQEPAPPGAAAAETGSKTSEPPAGGKPQRAVAAADESSPEKSQPKSKQGSVPKKTSSTKKGSSKSEPPGVPVDLAVVGQKGKILFQRTGVEVRGKGTVLDTLDAAGVAYETSHNSEFVVSVGGQKNSGMSGWMYQLNGKTVMKSAALQKVQPGDCVIWWFSEQIGEDPPQWSEL